MLSFFSVALLFPFAARLFLFPKKKSKFIDNCSGYLADGIYAFELLALFSFLSKPLFLSFFFLSQIYILLDAFFYTASNIRFRPSFFKQLVDPKSFFHSAQNVGLYLFLFSLLVMTLSLGIGVYFFSGSWKGLSPYLLFALPLTSLYLKGQENIFLFLQRESFKQFWSSFFQKREKLTFSSRSEVSNHLSPDYPLLKWTERFQGDAHFKVPKKEKPNLIFLSLESFRAKELAYLGSKHGATPNFDKLIQEGVFYSNFYSNGVLTVHGALSSLTGVFPENKPKMMISYQTDPLIGLGNIMKENGYQTTFMHNGNEWLDRQSVFFKNLGFDDLRWRNEIIKSFPHINTTYWGAEDEFLYRYALEYLDKKTLDPFLLCLYTITNHHPWTPVEGHIAPAFQVSKGSKYHNYLSTLHYSDQWLGFFIDELRKRDLAKNTYFILLGDHGASVKDEHSDIQCNLEYLDEEHIRVPLLILSDGLNPKVIKEPCSQIDMVPTIFDLLNLKGTNHSVGKSLIRKEKKDVFFFNPFGERYIGTRSGDQKYILNLKTQKESLFDLSKDPEEKENLANQYPAECKLLKNEAVKTERYFHYLYEKKKLAPKDQKVNSQFRLPSDWSDEKILKWSSKNRDKNSIHLSHNLNLNDQSIAPIFKHSSSLYHLNLSKCTGITDQTLQLMSEQCPKILTLNLNDCLMISDKGVQQIVENCTHLEQLRLRGVTGLTEKAFQNAQFTPVLLDLIGAEKITDASIQSLLPCLKRSEFLSLNCEYLTDESFYSIAEHCHQFTAMHLENGKNITDSGLRKLFDNTPALIQISLSYFPKISSQAFTPLIGRTVELLSFEGVNKLTDEWVPVLKQIQLCSIYLSYHSNITNKGIEALQRTVPDIYQI